MKHSQRKILSKLTFHVPDSLTQNPLDTFSVPLYLPRHIGTAHFTGRDELLLQVHSALKEESGTYFSSPVVLVGQGGIGKTQIAIEYVRRYRKLYTPIIWIDGTSLESTHRSFFDFAKHLWKHLEALCLNNTRIYNQLLPIFNPSRMLDHRRSKLYPAHESSRSDIVNESETNEFPREPLRHSQIHLSEVSETILDWLTVSQNSNWLIIFDNVDDINAFDIRDFMPGTADGNIIITSRRPEAARYGTYISIDALSQDDAVRLLLTTSQTKDEPDQSGK